MQHQKSFLVAVQAIQRTDDPLPLLITQGSINFGGSTTGIPKETLNVKEAFAPLSDRQAFGPGNTYGFCSRPELIGAFDMV